MFRADESTFRDGHHQLWLAMQTAHDEYSRASSVLSIRISDLSDNRQVDRNLVSAEQDYRAAFEAYIDARLRFSEFSRQPEFGQQAIHGGRRRGRGAWLALVAAALFALVGSVAMYSVPPRREVLQLKAERDQFQANLGLARRDLDALSRRIEAVAGNPPSRQPHQPQQISGQRRFSLKQVPRKLSSKQVPRKRNTPSRLATMQSHQEFTLLSSRHFTQVGPVRLSFRGSDVHNEAFDLFFIAGDSVVQRWRLKVYQPVRISIGSPPGSVELVVNRVSANQAHGYISIPRKSTSTSRSGGVQPPLGGM